MKIQFEWDENKNARNIGRHDIDFNDAWMIFDHPILKKIDKRRDYGEERWVALGMLHQIIVFVVYTHRKEKIRIISIRRANHHEREAYKKHYQKQN